MHEMRWAGTLITLTLDLNSEVNNSCRRTKLILDHSEIIETIRAKKRELGKQLIILTHHYQRKEIVELGDFVGDSFELSRKAAADRDCRYIVFCGVHFMAESAAILAQPHQVVQIPDVEAGCWMAAMAEAETVKSAWEQIESAAGEDSIIPVVYMNSDAELKSFCGNHGGIVCTSSNAAKAVKWAFGQKEKVLFFPDQHLGRNVGHDLGIAPEEMIVWSPGKPLGGNDPDAVRRARMILWDGYCLVHTRFTVEQIEKMRTEFPEARIIVHPECTREVVALGRCVRVDQLHSEIRERGASGFDNRYRYGNKPDPSPGIGISGQEGARPAPFTLSQYVQNQFGESAADP